MDFQVEFTSRAKKDLDTFPIHVQKHIVKKSLILETEPFSYKKTIKRIRGLKFPCFRLRINIENDSIRLFYGIEKNIIYVLRIVSKKDADKIITRIRKQEFPS